MLLGFFLGHLLDLSWFSISQGKVMPTEPSFLSFLVSVWKLCAPQQNLPDGHSSCDGQSALKQIDVPAYVCMNPWLSGAGKFCLGYLTEKQNKILQSCSGKMFLFFLASCTKSPALRAGEGTAAKIIQRGEQQGMKS